MGTYTCGEPGCGFVNFLGIVRKHNKESHPDCWDKRVCEHAAATASVSPETGAWFDSTGAQEKARGGPPQRTAAGASPAFITPDPSAPSPESAP